MIDAFEIRSSRPTDLSSGTDRYQLFVSVNPNSNSANNILFVCGCWRRRRSFGSFCGVIPDPCGAGRSRAASLYASLAPVLLIQANRTDHDGHKFISVANEAFGSFGPGRPNSD